MADRTISQIPAGTPDLDEILQAVLLQALDVAQEKLNNNEELVPFTALAVGDSLFLETHPAQDSEDCFKMAQHTVQNARGARAYAFCYDGYIDTDEGQLDAIIAEGGIPGEEIGHAVGYLYSIEEGAGQDEVQTEQAGAAQQSEQGDNLSYIFEENPVYIGRAPNFMEFTLILDEEVATEDETDIAEEGLSESSEGVGASADVEDIPAGG